MLDVATGVERQTIAETVELDGLAWLDGTHLLTMRDTATTDEHAADDRRPSESKVHAADAGSRDVSVACR